MFSKDSGSETDVFGFCRGPGGFREVREASRNHFHLSWYLIVPGITSYDQKGINKEITCFFLIFSRVRFS